MNAPDPRQERFNQLLSRIRQKAEELKKRNRALAEENQKLRHQLKNDRKDSDPFSTLGESERMALRQQIDGLIAKLDKHLDE